MVTMNSVVSINRALAMIENSFQSVIRSNRHAGDVVVSARLVEVLNDLMILSRTGQYEKFFTYMRHLVVSKSSVDDRMILITRILGP